MKSLHFLPLLLLVLALPKDIYAQSAENDPNVDVPVPENVTEPIFNMFGNDPDPAPTAVAVPLGWGRVPEDYRNANESAYTSLIVGAQFVANQAVLKGVFRNSIHNITTVHSSIFVYKPEGEESDGGEDSGEDGEYNEEYGEYDNEEWNNGEEYNGNEEEFGGNEEFGEEEHISEEETGITDPDLGFYYYTYDVEITNTEQESLRTTFTVQFRYWDNSFTVQNFSFVYDCTKGDLLLQVQLDWKLAQFDDIGFYSYSIYNGDVEYPHTKVVEETDTLPDWNTEINTPEFMELQGWTQTQIDDEDGYLDWVRQAGNNFAWIHMKDLPFSTDINSFYMTNYAYVKELEDGRTQYYFDSSAGADDGSFVRTFSQLIYDSVQQEVWIYSWSVNEYEGITYWFDF